MCSEELRSLREHFKAFAHSLFNPQGGVRLRGQWNVEWVGIRRSFRSVSQNFKTISEPNSKRLNGIRSEFAETRRALGLTTPIKRLPIANAKMRCQVRRDAIVESE